MPKKILLLLLPLLVLFALFFLHPPKNSAYFIPFDEAQIQDHYNPGDLINFYHRLKKKNWKTLHRLYNAHLKGRQKHHKKTRIPKIIHQICLGSHTPERLEKYRQSWVNAHPDWEYHLWTEKEVNILYLKNRSLYLSAESEEEKSTLLRYEILDQFGGVFVSLDFECLKPLDILSENCDFFAGMSDEIHHPEIHDALIGSTPGHPVLKACILKLRDQRKGGSALFTQAFFDAIKEKGSLTNVILPATFFYPIPASMHDDPDHEKWIRENTFAIHH